MQLIRSMHFKLNGGIICNLHWGVPSHFLVYEPLSLTSASVQSGFSSVASAQNELGSFPLLRSPTHRWWGKLYPRKSSSSWRNWSLSSRNFTWSFSVARPSVGNPHQSLVLQTAARAAAATISSEKIRSHSSSVQKHVIYRQVDTMRPAGHFVTLTSLSVFPYFSPSLRVSPSPSNLQLLTSLCSIEETRVILSEADQLEAERAGGGGPAHYDLNMTHLFSTLIVFFSVSRTSWIIINIWVKL